MDGIISENQAPMDDSHKQDALHENQRKSKKPNAKDVRMLLRKYVTTLLVHLVP